MNLIKNFDPFLPLSYTRSYILNRITIFHIQKLEPLLSMDYKGDTPEQNIPYLEEDYICKLRN